MGMPPAVMELPGGSPSDVPPMLPEDLLCCYMIQLAMGVKGLNYYVFTGGPNVPDTGDTTDVYDYAAPIGADGRENPTFEAFKRFTNLMRDKPLAGRSRARGRRAGGIRVGGACAPTGTTRRTR